MSLLPGPKPVEDDAPLWRYVSLSALFHYLAGKAFVPSVQKLEKCDPTEGLAMCGNSDWADNAFTDAEWKEFWDWICEARLSPEAKCHYERAGAFPSQSLVWWWEYHRVLATTRYAWCWFNSEHESAAMWQLYGKGGAAIRTSPRKLSPILDQTGKNWLVSRMHYLDRNKPWHPEDFGPEHLPILSEEKRAAIEAKVERMREWIRRPFLVKRIEYQHENEVRFVSSDAAGLDGLPLSLKKPETWIEEIVLCPGFPEAEANSLVAAVSKVVPALAQKTRRSLLFQRDPILTPSSFLKECLRDNESQQRAQAERWPELLKRL